jgi:Fe-S-cluster containining protein
MGLTRSQADAQLQALYDQIPSIPDCDGRCWTSCGPIDMSDRERHRIRKAGHRITPWRDALASLDAYYCEALTGEKRCAVYESRPLVCRLWGATEGLKCPFGCIPEGGWLTDHDGYRLIFESLRIGGHPRAAEMPSGRALDEALAAETFLRAMAPIMERGRKGDQQRASRTLPAAFRRADQ